MTDEPAAGELTTEGTVYVTYVATTPDRLWSALTNGTLTKDYFFGRTVESDWKRGSPWLLRKPDGAVEVRGEVRDSDAPRRLVLSWRVEAAPDLPESVVSYEIAPAGGGVVRLTMTEAHPTPMPKPLLEGGRRGWPMILSGLKTLLETGKPLGLATPSK
ncbi:MAG TPA: SRPBCC family protein [Alphaproteobacteria bacterium]|jgi:uncharacterized protein YndB with AHSA1/START domain